MSEKWHPKAYQVEGVEWLLSKPFSGLLMRPGLGKSSTVLAAATILRKKKLVKRILVVAPATVADIVWREEIAKWGFPLRTAFAHGAKFESVIQDKSIDLVTMTADGVQRLYNSFTPLDISKLFDWLVVDESTKFRTPKAKRFKILKKYLTAFARRTILTGTIAPNGYRNLWAQTYIVDRGLRLFKLMTRYYLEYFDSVGFGGYEKVLKRGAAKKIQAKLSDILLFIDDEALGLEKFRINTIKIRMPPKAEAQYAELRRESVMEIGDVGVTAVNAAVLQGKLRQMANGSVYGDGKKVIKIHDVKAEAVADLVEQMQDNPLILGYEFDTDRDAIIAALCATKKERDALLVIGGSTSKTERRRILATFNTGEHPVLLAQVGTIAHGLNLQDACHTVCFFGPIWDAEYWTQFIKRVHRLGQKKKVVVHVIIAEGTLDAGVLAVQRKKGATERDLLRALALHLKEGN